MSGVVTTVHQSWADRETTFVRTQDVEPILANNARLRELEQPSDWGRHVAAIPNVIIERWLHEAWDSGNTGLQLGSAEWLELVWKKINSPEWAYLRVDKPTPAYRR